MMDQAQTKVVDAYQLATRGNFDHARLILEETLYDHPEHIEAWLLMADLAEEAEDARQCYQMVLELAPDHWIAQQRMKLLFGQQEPPEPEIDLLQIFEEEDGEEEQAGNQAVTFEPAAPEFLNDFVKADTPPKPPTLKESYQAHKKLVLGLGAGIIALFGIGLISWLASVGFIVWKTGFLAWFGF